MQDLWIPLNKKRRRFTHTLTQTYKLLQTTTVFQPIFLHESFIYSLQITGFKLKQDAAINASYYLIIVFKNRRIRLSFKFYSLLSANHFRTLNKLDSFLIFNNQHSLLIPSICLFRMTLTFFRAAILNYHFWSNFVKSLSPYQILIKLGTIQFTLHINRKIFINNQTNILLYTFIYSEGSKIPT